MDIGTFLFVIILIHASFYFTDQFLKSCMNVPYLCFLENVGLTVKPLQLHWFTTVFNRSVTKWALWRPKFFKVWFTLGVVVVGILLIPAVCLLISELVNHLRPLQEQTVQALQPMVPGINLPVKELPYYFFTLLIASVIHEAGHAIAAVKEDVHVNGFGFLLMFVLPGAYVDVPTEEIRTLTPFRQLKILCAGVWHNIVLVLLALGIGLSTPFILQPLYVHGRGLTVMKLSQDSPAKGPTGLEVGDVITAVNRQTVVSVHEWLQCLVSSVTSDQMGFCVPESVVHTYDETIHHAFEGADGSVQCCSGDSDAHLCFELLEDRELDKGVSAMQPFSCLPARMAVSLSMKTCINSVACPTDTHCLAPSLRNASRLMQLSRRGRNGERKEDVLYLGPPSYLYHTVTLTSYIPKFSFLSLTWPNTIEVYCDYMVKFSGALAVLNMIPVVYLDGYWIFGAVIDMLLSSRCDQVTRKIIHAVVTMIGSLLLFLNIIIGVWSII
ncbi:membrane-bound transcription factor site-2 protease-like isoform X2 [Homarus americanus]|uniref:Membrane-bound transcription factor site-2 protease n=1 Tax=Homarus americanus TaxID=6706 RepID=A0A8J5JY13_HOMAM|nr:membrane-bound transcription factor site-2 protease-like isoform X2 [Homarus americanus]KAG7166652.1 Membrane-bound transcription factor site-2 protease-like [Homarus americanus]